MKKTTFVFLLLFSFRSYLSFGQWIQTNGPNVYGGFVRPIVQVGNYIYAIIPSQSLFVSSDNGTSWRIATNSFMDTVYCVTADQQNVFISTYTGVYKSNYNALNWSPVLDSGLSPGTKFISLELKNNFLFGGAADGIYLSTNWGNSWIHALTSNTGPIGQIVFDDMGILNPVMYAASSNELYTSSNGYNWNSLNFNLTAYSLAAHYQHLYVGTAYGFYLSNDYGHTYQLLSGQNSQIWSLFSSGNTLYAGFTTGLYSTTDNGNNWINLIPNIDIVSISANGDNIAVGSNGYGVRISSDGGQNWRNASNGLIPIQISQLTSNGNNVYAGTYGDGVFKTNNNGSSWQSLNGIISMNYIRQLTFSDSNLFALEPGQIIYSSNNGTNWSSIGDGGSILAARSNYIYLGKGPGDAPDSEDFKNYGGDKAFGLNLSSNNGYSWSLIYDGVVPSAIAVNSHAIVAHFIGTVVSTDNGSTWQNADNGLPPGVAEDCFYFFKDKILAGFHGHGIYLSSNYGSSWSSINSSSLNLNVNCFTSFGNTIIAGTDSGIYKADGLGNNWVDFSSGLPSNTIVTSLTENGSKLFAATGNKGIWERSLSELTGIQSYNNNIPNEFSLSQNYPNPFNPSTKIKFSIPPSPLQKERGSGGEVKLIIYDILGKEVATLINEKLSPGTYEVEWNATNSPSGVYLYKLSVGDYREVKRMMLIK